MVFNYVEQNAFYIAELSGNHDQDFNSRKQWFQALEAGVDAIKAYKTYTTPDTR